jgi:diguanylate cyclase (GGDEF)-like protein
VGWRALAVPLCGTVAALGVLGVDWGDGRVGLGEVCALACLLASLARTVLTFRELRALQEVRQQAVTDHLTGLPNRRALASEMDRLVRDGRRAALILLDLDGFKAVNDGLGHRAGDELLRRLGALLRPALRPGDLLFRLGGDEFAVLLADAPVEAADECARRLHSLVCRPVELDGARVQVGASLGVAAADGATSVDDLLHHADLAMYAAKSGQGGVRWFSAGGDQGSMSVGAPACADLAFGLRVAGNGRPVSAVALHRHGDPDQWRRADLTALDGVCAAATRWWPSKKVPVELSVNAQDLAVSRLADRVTSALLRAGLPPTALLLWLEDAALTAAPEAVPTLLAALRARGIPTGVEAYGGGAVALARLRDLTVDRIALDPAVVADVVTDPKASLVVAHTVALARALGSTVQADSVDVHTDAALARLGCEVLHAGAGPVPADRLERRLRESDDSDVPVG